MSTSLAWLVSRLKLAVPAVDGNPNDAQYEECVSEAVADLGQRKPSRKIVTLAVVSGTAAYALPADFIRMTAFEKLEGDNSVLVTATGLVDLGGGLSETYSIAGQTLTITPTPGYTAERQVMYAAGHVLDTTDSYPDLSAEDARLALVKAQALVLGVWQNSLLAGAYSYRIGDVQEDRGGQIRLIEVRSAALERTYLDGIRQALGPVGSRNRGSIWNGPYGSRDTD